MHDHCHTICHISFLAPNPHVVPTIYYSLFSPPMVPMLPIHSARAHKTRRAHITRILFSALAHGADAEVAALAHTLNLNAEMFADTGNMPLKISGRSVAYSYTYI